MPSPYWIDVVALALVVGFGTKGFMLGLLRSVASLVAVAAAWLVALFFPMLSMPLLVFLGEPSPLWGPWAAKVLSFSLTFSSIQLGAYFLTGLFEKVGLGPINKGLGALLGVLTGVVVGCLPIAAVHALPPLYRSPAVQNLAKQSLAWQQYTPVVSLFVKTPRRTR